MILKTANTSLIFRDLSHYTEQVRVSTNYLQQWFYATQKQQYETREKLQDDAFTIFQETDRSRTDLLELVMSSHVPSIRKTRVLRLIDQGYALMLVAENAFNLIKPARAIPVEIKETLENCSDPLFCRTDALLGQAIELLRMAQTGSFNSKFQNTLSDIKRMAELISEPENPTDRYINRIYETGGTYDYSTIFLLETCGDILQSIQKVMAQYLVTLQAIFSRENLI